MSLAGSSKLYSNSHYLLPMREQANLETSD